MRVAASGGAAAGERPLREVTLTQGFWMAETEFTQQQWEVATGERVVLLFSIADGRVRPVQDPAHPMVMASWTRVCGERPPNGGLLGNLNTYLRQQKSPWIADLPTEALRRSPAGVRAQAIDRAGSLVIRNALSFSV